MINVKRKLLRKVLMLVLVMDMGCWSETIMVGNLARRRRERRNVFTIRSRVTLGSIVQRTTRLMLLQILLLHLQLLLIVKF
jgi:hypothetical protein